MQELDINKWHLSSQSNENGYTVTKKMENCSRCEDQVTVCTNPECVFLCWHMYTCDTMCYEYNNGHVCKHIHRVHSVNVQKQNDVTAHLSSTSESVPCVENNSPDAVQTPEKHTSGMYL